MYWTIPYRDELRTQLEQAEYDLQIFKKATVAEQKDLPRPQIEIADITIRWVKGHDKKSLATSQITKANWESDKIAGRCADLTGIPSRRWIKVYPLDERTHQDMP